MSLRTLSARGLSQYTAFLFLFFTFLAPNKTFAQNQDFAEKGLFNHQQAVARLGNRLNRVAAKHGKTAPELRRLLLQDRTLHVDGNDKLLYIETTADAAQVAAAENSFVASPAGPFPYSQTFKLHSRPGSNRVIYLDFNGHTISQTSVWSSYMSAIGGVAAPFNMDGDPTSFNTIEQDVIQGIWQRIAEDYAPFDVDVTTEDPGNDALNREGWFDQKYGIRAVMTATNFMGAGIGGVAYVGIFDYDGGADYQPAWIFTTSLGNSEKNITEAASHEIGHTLGLNHDGLSTTDYYSGHGVWAPIMGVGYNKNISQWSKGEYPGASNTEDDLTIIQSHGLTLIADDHGNTRAAATVLNGNSINVSGLITTQSDVDVFKFTTGAGSVSININPAPRGGNLDIKAQILDSAGNLIATSDPSSYALQNSFPAGISAGFNQTLPAGTYFLTVDGTRSAQDDPTYGYTEYASIGQYTIIGTLAAGNNAQAPVAIIAPSATSGAAPLAINFTGSGSYDPDGTIVGYSWNFGDGTSSTVQNPAKIYTAAGTFNASLTVTDNSGQTGTASVAITVTNLISTYSLGGFVMYGITPVGQSAKYVPGVTLSATGSSIVSATTNNEGTYLLANLISGGQYVVTPAKNGQINGITTFDATLILRHVAAGGGVLSGNQLIAADVNGDNRVTTFDATQVLRFVASGAQNSTTGQTGTWKFSPAPRNYNAIISSIAGENYDAVLLGDVNGSWSPSSSAFSEYAAIRSESEFKFYR